MTRRPLHPSIAAAVARALPDSSKPKRPRRGVQNRTEQRYASILEARKLAGEVLSYAFEKHKFRLATRAFYTPDFEVELANGEKEYHEVKGGFIREASLVRLKVAAHQHPEHRFYLCQLKDGQWSRRIVKP